MASVASAHRVIAEVVLNYVGGAYIYIRHALGHLDAAAIFVGPELVHALLRPRVRGSYQNHSEKLGDCQ